MRPTRTDLPAGKSGLPLERGALTALLLALAVTAMAVHGAGHVSMDSSAQLYEALTGRSVSWSPPLMSAMLRWAGGGLGATTAFVVACSLLTYGGFALALSGAGRSAAGGKAVRLRRALGVLAILLAILNPLVFFHVGIVWKDVLFASFTVFGAGLLLVATGRGFGRDARWLYLAAAAALIPAVLVRQQGIVLVPPLLFACAVGAAGPWNGARDRQAWRRVAGWLLVFAVATAGLHALSKATITGSGDKATSTGFSSIRKYDITGMVAGGHDAGVALPAALRTADFRAAAMGSYSDDRIDHIMAEPAVVTSLKPLSDAEVARIWWSLVRANPDAYVAMKARQLAWLFGLRRLDRCLPIHLGVEGNAEYLAAAGVPRGMDALDRGIYQWSLKARHLVFYRHWFYAALLVVAAGWIVAARRRYQPAELVAVASLVLGLALFYASFSVTVLACDVRYLYPGLAGVTVLWIFLLSRHCLPARREPT